jgi:ribosomal protein S18 acetylase RimI-like enzyme
VTRTSCFRRRYVARMFNDVFPILVTPDMPRALGFYRKRGFREIARRPIAPDPDHRYPDDQALLLVRES